MHGRNISNMFDLFTCLFYFLFSSVAYWHFKRLKVHLSFCWKTSASINIASSGAASFPAANDQTSLPEKHHMSSEEVVSDDESNFSLLTFWVQLLFNV